MFSMKKAVLKNFAIFTVKQLFLQVYRKETLRQMFSCEYCEIYKNTYFEEYLRAAAFILSHFHTRTKLFGFLMDFFFSYITNDSRYYIYCWPNHTVQEVPFIEKVTLKKSGSCNHLLVCFHKHKVYTSLLLYFLFSNLKRWTY